MPPACPGPRAGSSPRARRWSQTRSWSRRRCLGLGSDLSLRGTDGSPPNRPRGTRSTPTSQRPCQSRRPARMRPALTPLQLLAFPVANVPRRERGVHPEGRRTARLRHGGSAAHCARVRRALQRAWLLSAPPNSNFKQGVASLAAPHPAPWFSGIPYPL